MATGDANSSSSRLALFTEVTACERCPANCEEKEANCVKRDRNYNIPQPAWLGREYAGLVFVGQNPGEGSTPPTSDDAGYLDALRVVSDKGSLDLMHDTLKEATESFVYYRSFHFDVNIEKVAYINAVRCRTVGNAAPGEKVARNCRVHFLNWIRKLSPKGVVYLGVYAKEATSDILDRFGVQHVTISRQRNLKSELREKQMARALQFIEVILSETLT